MHYIIIDTNIVYGTFYLESNDWKRLLRLNKWEKCEVCVPEFVVDEIIKKYRDCISKTINELKKVKDDVKRYHLSEISLGDLKKNQYVDKYARELQIRLENEHIRILPYPNHKEYIKQISKRYFQNIKPFDINKSSFQDVIIWYSILDFVRGSEAEDRFYFITKNSKDFAESEDKNKFHQQLLEDLSEEERERVSLYHNIEIFYEKNQDLLNDYEDEIENQKEEDLQKVQEIVKEYINSICLFENNKDLKKMVIDDNIVEDYIESDLLNSSFENDYGDVGWGEEVYTEDSFLLEEETEVEFTEDLKGYAIFEVNVEVGYSVVTKNPLYEDSDDDEFLYDGNHHKEYNLYIQLSFEIEKYIHFYDAEVWEA